MSMENATVAENLTTGAAWLIGLGTAMPTAGNATDTHQQPSLEPAANQCAGFSPEDVLDLREDELTAASYLMKDSLKGLMLPVLYAVLAVATLGNLAFFVVLARVPHMRNTTNLFLANLAAADIAFVVISVACYQIYFSHPVRSHYGTARALGCVGAFGGQYVTYYASLAIVTLVSAERYSSICRPLRHRSVNTRRRAVRLLAGSWVLAFALTGVVMLRYTRLDLRCLLWPETERYRGLPVLIGYCLPSQPWGLLLANLTESVPFVAAFVANVCMYVGIIRTLSNRTALQESCKEGKEGASLSQRATRVRRQVAKMLMATGVVFFLCNTPFVAISVSFIVSHLRGLPMLEIYESMAGLLVISHGMLFLNSAANPIIYNATSSHYREAFRDAFCCADTSGRPRLDSSTVAAVSGSKRTPVEEKYTVTKV